MVTIYVRDHDPDYINFSEISFLSPRTSCEGTLLCYN